MPSLPLPQSLPKECRKAEKILKSFMETSRGGLDGVRLLPSIHDARTFRYERLTLASNSRLRSFLETSSLEPRAFVSSPSSKLASCSLLEPEVVSSSHACPMGVRRCACTLSHTRLSCSSPGIFLRSGWSAPSAIGTAGMGFGGQAGAGACRGPSMFRRRAVHEAETPARRQRQRQRH